jgi:hypothetical protein
MLKHGEINPLNVHGLRQLHHCPPHFEKVLFDIKTREKDITDWIYENLEGRFYIGNVDEKLSGKIQRKACVGFESPGEASYFSLFLEQINKNDWLI